MKKTIAVLLMCSTFVLSACDGSSAPPTTQVDKGTHESITEIPFTMKYNDKDVILTDISFYDTKLTSSPTWHPYMIARFDLSALTEDERQLIMEPDFDRNGIRGRDLSVDCNYTSEQNDVEFNMMPSIATYYDGDGVVFAFYDYNVKGRKDFSDLEARFDVHITQDEKYEENGHKDHKVNEYTCYINQFDGLEIPVLDESEIPASDQHMIAQGMQKKMQ